MMAQSARIAFRRKLQAALTAHMNEALGDDEWIDEANVCLDALCWLARIDVGDFDQEREITSEERDAVVAQAFEGKWEYLPSSDA